MTGATFDIRADTAHVLPLVRHPSEKALRFLVAVVATGVWALLIWSLVVSLVVSLAWILYVALFGLLFFIAHVGFVFHLRGNAVRLGTEQMPELYRRVEELSHRMGLAATPETYVLQAGGALNALATKFLRRNFIVLYADLLEACGDNEEARDFIIAHELGHIAAGHLRWRWFLLPGLLTPLLAHAYSRACETTCDRYGFAVCGESAAALSGLCVLAAGGELGPGVNRRALARQREDLNSAWMTLARWFATHPPLAHRMATLDTSLVEGELRRGGARFGAAAALTALVCLPTAAIAAVAVLAAVESAQRAAVNANPGAQQASATQLVSAEPGGQAGATPVAASAQRVDPATIQTLRVQIRRDMAMLAEVAEAFRREQGVPPADTVALYALWPIVYSQLPAPLDPFSGGFYLYGVEEENYALASVGFLANDPSDDLHFTPAPQRAVEGAGTGRDEPASVAGPGEEAPATPPEDPSASAPAPAAP